MPYFSESSWTEFALQQGLDARISKTIPKLKLSNPTAVQEKACPAILSGRDVLVKSPTGTGKSLAYVIPLLQRLISSPSTINPLAMVLVVPTKELCGQVFAVCSGLMNYLFDVVSVDCYTGDDKYKRPSLPSIMITTPRGLVKLCTGPSAHKLASSAKDNIRYVAVDEADLVLSHGFEKDIRTIVSTILPKEYQAVLVSATLSDDLETLKGLMLRSPISIIIDDEEISGEVSIKKPTKTSITPQSNNPTCKQYYMSLPSRDKFLALYGMIKTEVVGGRILIFTSSVDNAYKIKIFFDKFAIKSGVFNCEMPIECRNRVLSAYNDNLFSILIASNEETSSDDPESASHRGIDFSNVNVVINFDLPKSVAGYTHRAGRTARGGKSGVVVSFVDSGKDEEVSFMQKIASKVGVDALNVSVASFEPLRYRVEDVSKGISRRAIAASRQKELLTEILHNDEMKKKLSENSEEVQALRQSVRNLREHAKIKWHLQELPEYLVPDLKGIKPLVGKSSDDVATKLAKKRKSMENDQMAMKKKRKLTLREKLVNKDQRLADDDTVAPDELAPISGRKLWKIKHHKRVKRMGEGLGKPPRIARKLWKSAKKFSQ